MDTEPSKQNALSKNIELSISDDRRDPGCCIDHSSNEASLSLQHLNRRCNISCASMFPAECGKSNVSAFMTRCSSEVRAIVAVASDCLTTFSGAARQHGSASRYRYTAVRRAHRQHHRLGARTRFHEPLRRDGQRRRAAASPRTPSSTTSMASCTIRSIARSTRSTSSASSRASRSIRTSGTGPIGASADGAAHRLRGGRAVAARPRSTRPTRRRAPPVCAQGDAQGRPRQRA